MYCYFPVIRLVNFAGLGGPGSSSCTVKKTLKTIKQNEYMCTGPRIQQQTSFLSLTPRSTGLLYF